MLENNRHRWLALAGALLLLAGWIVFHRTQASSPAPAGGESSAVPGTQPGPGPNGAAVNGSSNPSTRTPADPIGPVAPAAEIRVALVTDLGAHLDAGRVSLRCDGATVGSADVEAQSREAVFRNLPAGKYVPWVDAKSIPPTLLPPVWQVRLRGAGPDGAEPPYAFEYRGTGVCSAVVPIVRAATLGGVVDGPDRQPTRKAFIRLSPDVLAEATRHGQELNLDSEGRFETRLYPGAWFVTVLTGTSQKAPTAPSAEEQALLWSNHSELTDLPAPFPRLVHLEPGENRQLEFVFGGGPCTIIGTIVDQRGEAFANLSLGLVVVSLPDDRGQFVDIGLMGGVAHAVTDGSGRFSIQGLQPGSYALYPPLEGYSACSGPNRAGLGRIPGPIPVTAGNGVNELGSVLVARCDPVGVSGLVQLDPAWAASHHVTARQVGVAVVCPASAAHSGEIVCEGIVAEDGQFDLYVQRAESGALLRLSYGPELLLVPLDMRAASESVSTGVIVFPQ